jgi:hypothetical protein
MRGFDLILELPGCVCKIIHNVRAFVLLGTSFIRRPRRRLPNVFIKDKNLFCCSIVNVKLGQKLNSKPKDERRYSSAPIAQMRLLAAELIIVMLSSFIFDL